MTYPTTFANLAAGNQPLSLVDTMFNIVGQQGAIPCTPSGTNTITLTPATNYYAPAALTNGIMLSFLAANTTSGAVTVQLLALGALNLYTSQGSQAGAGDIANGSHYILQYWSDLNGSVGGWLIVNSNGTRVGYGPTAQGIGTSVQQTTSQTTTVTANALCGAITMFTASAVSTAIVHFTVSNSLVGPNDTIVLNVKTATVNRYVAVVSVVTTGSFDVSIQSSAVGATDSPTLNFAVIKAVAS